MNNSVSLFVKIFIAKKNKAEIDFIISALLEWL